MELDADATSDVVSRALRVARAFCGMDLSYVSEFHDGAQWLRRRDGDETWVDGEVDLDAPIPLEMTYCQRMVDGRLPNVVPDTLADPVTADLPITHASGQRAYVGVPIRLRNGLLYGTLCCVSETPRADLGAEHTELLTLLAQVIGEELGREDARTASGRAQNEFLATVSHDLRTPLRAISFIAEDLMESDHGLDPHEAATMIKEEVEVVTHMVDDVLLIARQRSGVDVVVRTPVDLLDVVRRAVRSSTLGAGADGARIRAELPEGPLTAELDGDRVAQALRNLLDNALKYSPDGGDVELRLRRDDSTAVVEVQDHGIGMPEADQRHVGERFFRAATAREHGIDGIGLGLASVLAIAQAHDGVLSFTSAPGEGSTFRLRLPLGRAD